MVIVFLAIILIILLFLNYYLSDYDLLNPSFLFCAMNLANTVICVFASMVYRFEFHLNTVIVIVFGVLVFTFFNVLCRLFKRSDRKVISVDNTTENDISRITYYPKLQRWWIVLFILFEIAVAYTIYDYIMNIGRAYGGSGLTFQKSMGIYNLLLKNATEELVKLGVKSSPLRTHGLSLSIGVSLILLGIMLNNYYTTKKVEPFVLVACAVVVVMSFFTGARSRAFKVVLAYLIEWVIIRRMYVKSYKKGNLKLLSQMILLCVAILIAFFALTKVIGRSTNFVWFEYIVAYIGAPLMNLDIYLQDPWYSTEVWGQETFHNLYSFIESQFGVDGLVYMWNQPYNYHNGIYLGNVYTMYYAYIQDFGFIGVLPLTAIPAVFYNGLYSQLVDYRTKKPALGFVMFLYTYMFSSLLVLTFTNRFYDDVLRSEAIRVYLWMAVFWFAFRKIKISIGNKRLF